MSYHSVGATKPSTSILERMTRRPTPSSSSSGVDKKVLIGGGVLGALFVGWLAFGRKKKKASAT